MTDTTERAEPDMSGHYEGEPVGQLRPDDAARLREIVEEPSAELVPSGSTFPAAQQRVTLLRTYVDLAARLCGTEFVPKGLRGKPAAVLACMLTGQEMGIGPMQALTHIHVVDGRPTQSAELMRAQILRAGHRFSVREKSNDKVTVYGKRSDTGEELVITWTMADANRAKLVKKDSAWETYPRAMLMARATSELARDLFADVLGGVSYTPEELGAEVMVTDGGYIDVTGTETVAATSTGPSGPLDPTAAWDRVNAMKARDVVDELKRLNLSPGGKEADLRARLAEAYTTTAPEPSDTAPSQAAQDVTADTPQDASDSAPTNADDAPEASGEQPTPEPSETATAPERPSTKAQAVKKAKAAVDEMSDERVAEMVTAYEHEPVEDVTHRRGQLIGLLVDEWEAEHAAEAAR